MSKYPRLNSRVKCKTKQFKSQDGKKCFICGVRTDGSAEIEVNCFRGDDEKVSVCNAHTAKEIIDNYKLVKS